MLLNNLVFFIIVGVCLCVCRMVQITYYFLIALFFFFPMWEWQASMPMWKVMGTVPLLLKVECIMGFYEKTGKWEAFLFYIVIKASTYYTTHFMQSVQEIEKFSRKGMREYGGKNTSTKIFFLLQNEHKLLFKEKKTKDQ